MLTDKNTFSLLAPFRVTGYFAAEVLGASGVSPLVELQETKKIAQKDFGRDRSFTMLLSSLKNLNILCRYQPLVTGGVFAQATSHRCISCSSMLAVHHREKIRARWVRKTERFMNKMSWTVSGGGGPKAKRYV